MDDHVPRFVVLLVGLILLLAGCNSWSTSDTTSPAVVIMGTLLPSTLTSTSSTSTSTTQAPLDPTQCSAVDLNGEVENYTGAYDGLPDPVEATRKAIIEAALSCDFDTLMTIDVPHVEQGTWSEDRPSIFGGVTTNFDEFVGYDQQHSALRMLVKALSSVPVERVESETRDRVPVNGYQWPPHALLYDADTATMQSLNEVWDDDVIERVAALNGMTPSELIASVAEFDDHALFEVLILDDGSWGFAGGGE